MYRHKKNIFYILAAILISASLCSAGTPAGTKETAANGEKLYNHYCTPCHGTTGNGKGFNAKNLDPRPIDHTDAVFMSKRSDKELARAISGGGKAVGKSTLMPPWGNTFKENQTGSLILYLRTLCNCKQLQ